MVDKKLGQYAKFRCGSMVCNDQLEVKVVGDHFVTWPAVCTGREVHCTEDHPIFELSVVSAGRVVSMTASCLTDNTAPWQLTWLGPRTHDGRGGVLPEWDGCSDSGTKWAKLGAASSQWGVEPLTVLEQAMARELATNERSVLVGEASGGGVSAGQGITARVVPQSPGVGQFVRQSQAQSPPSVGTPEWRAGAARVSRDQQESQSPGPRGDGNNDRREETGWRTRQQVCCACNMPVAAACNLPLAAGRARG